VLVLVRQVCYYSLPVLPAVLSGVPLKKARFGVNLRFVIGQECP